MFFPFLAHQQGLERKWWKFACRSRASEGAAFGPFALEQLEDDMSNCKVLANTTNGASGWSCGTATLKLGALPGQQGGW